MIKKIQHAIYATCLILVLTQCSSPYYKNDHWYALSDHQKTHILDAHIQYAEQSEKNQPVTYLGNQIQLTFIRGQLLTQHLTETIDFTKTTLNINYDDCKKINLCNQDKTICRKLMICYQDDMVLIGKDKSHGHEALRIYRSPLWHQGFDYHPVFSPLPLGLKNTHINIQLINHYKHG